MKGQKNDFSTIYFRRNRETAKDEIVTKLKYVHNTDKAEKWLKSKEIDWDYANVYNRRQGGFIDRIYNPASPNIQTLKNDININNMNNNFSAPQIIKDKSGQFLGLSSENATNSTYFKLEQVEGKLKRTAENLNIENSELLKGIAAKDFTVVKPSKNYIDNNKSQSNDSDLNINQAANAANNQDKKFSAPQIIEDQEKNKYGLASSDAQKVNYYKLSLNETDNKLKRTEEIINFDIKDLANKIKNKEIKVIVPSKDFIAQKESEVKLEEKLDKQAEEPAKNITVPTANKRVQKEISESNFRQDKDGLKLQQIKNKDLLEQYPDKINGQSFDNKDKLDLLSNKKVEKAGKSYELDAANQIVIKEKAEVLGYANESNSLMPTVKQEKKSLDKSAGLEL